MSKPPPAATGNDRISGLNGAGAAFVGVGLTSGFLNLLGLTGSIYMLQVYDRAIPGRSLPTLLALSALAAGLYFAQGFFDVVRTRLLTRIGAHLDARLRAGVFGATIQIPLQMSPAARSYDPPRDLDTVRAFLSSNGPTALFDIPWMPIYLILVFALHPILGLLATGGALIMVGLTALTEWLTQRPSAAAAASSAQKARWAEASRRNAEAVVGLGMMTSLAAIWERASAAHLDDQVRAADLATTLSVVSKIIRLALQSAVLGLGAYLVIEQQATSGVMIAASITVARALAPVEIAVGNWRGFVAARQSYHRLQQLLAVLPLPREKMRLPPPVNFLSVEGLTVGGPGTVQPLIRDVTFQVAAGSAVGVIGMSGSGKSTLARALVGAWSPLRGAVRLDGTALDHWPDAQRAQCVGYLPQDTELFAGSVAQNIARFAPDPDPGKIFKAAQLAGVDQMIAHMPGGFDTEIGEGGAVLSAGQRQRIGLARALYDDPFVVVLDEPNSNLDTDGEAALVQAIFAVRERGGIVIVIAHRSSALAAVDRVLVMNGGNATLYGERDSVLQTLARQRAQLRVIPPTPPSDASSTTGGQSGTGTIG